MQKKEINDQFGLIPVVQRAFPNALIEQAPRFDEDTYWGFRICPKIGSTINFLVEHHHPLNILIEKIETVMLRWEPPVVYKKQIFNGAIPAGDDGPDTDFIEKLLINWANIG